MVDLSIALLTRNAGAIFPRVLEAISKQETRRRVEIVAVDSGSTDGTRERLEAAGARVITIAPREFNFGATRDLVYTYTRGAIIVNLSQDAVPAHPRWLENLLAPLDADDTTAASCGASIPDPARGYPQFPWERNGYFYFTREMRTFAARYGRGLSFANSAVRRSAWEAIRFQPIILGEDFQFQKNLHARGLAIAFPEGAEVLHHHDYDLAALIDRCRREGRALRALGVPYTVGDLVRDWASLPKYRQWIREYRRGTLTTRAARLFPIVRPWAVWRGSRDADGK